MLVRQIGEAGGRQTQAVQAMLIQPMARCFDGGMRHALPRQGGEVLMQLHRIGRGEAGVALKPGRDDAERAHARRLEAERRPDVAQEVHGRGLAVGAGDGGNGGGLQAGEGRRHQGHTTAGIGVAQHGDGGVERRQGRVGRGQDCHGATTHRIGDERRAVLMGAGQGREQIARLCLA